MSAAMSVVFRADASARLGSGHVTRCASLASALRTLGARCLFLCREVEGHLLGWLAEQGFETAALPAGPEGEHPWSLDGEADARHTLDAIGRHVGHADWLVVDHYGLDARWESRLRPLAGRLLAIDDLADRPHDVDALVDQNLQDREGRYRGLVPARCKALLGPRHALLRPQFAQAAASRGQRQEKAASAGRVLACMGGTDPHDVLSTVLAAWSRLPAPRPALDIAVGRNSPNAQSLGEACARHPGAQFHLQAPDMAGLMAQADLAVCSAGGISWERCCAGLPAIMGTTADNQAMNLQRLRRERTGLSVGRWQDLDAGALQALLTRALRRPALLRRMGARAQRLVDGRGAERVAAFMMANRLALRPARPEDAARVWPWRNAESTRRHFFDPRPVPLPAHTAWWDASLADPTRTLQLAWIGELPVGVLRLDHADDGTATVSIYVDPALTGLGLGPAMLRAAQAWARGPAAPRRPARLAADILPANAASIASFEAAGFVRAGGRWTWEPTAP